MPEFPADICKLKKLTALNLGYNKIERVPPVIGLLSGTLTNLTLSGNQLRELPEELGKLVHVTELTVSKNALVALPESLGDMAALVTLNAMLNRIERLPKSIGRLKNLSKLKLSVNQLHDVPAELGGLENLTELDLSSCHIVELPDVFDGFKRLDTLNVRNNLIAELPKSVCNVLALRVIDARNNELSKLPKKIGQLTGLKTLHVSVNLLESLPSSTGSLKALTTLSVDQNQLMELPQHLFALSALVTLDAHHNSIMELPEDESLSHLAALQSLDLRNNCLTKLPKAIGSLPALKKLYLSENEIREIPKTIGRLANLLELEVCNNKLTALPREIGDCSRLSLLEVTRNQITEVPETIGKIGALMQLKLGSNRISALDESLFDGLGELLNLNVFANRLRHLPASVAKCQKLQRINVSYNQLKELPPEIRSLRALQHVAFAGNAFAVFPKAICALPLKEIFASCNRFTELPADIGRLKPSLQVLDLAANALAALPDELCDLSSLKELELGHNRLVDLPSRMSDLAALTNLDLSNNVGLKVDRGLIESLVNVQQLKLAYCEMGKFPQGAALPPELGLLSLEGNLLDWSALDEQVRSRSELSAFSSRDKRTYEISWAEMRGRRPSQEDTIVIHTNKVDAVNWKAAKGRKGGHDLGIAAVFDGHRGAAAAEFSATHLIEVLYKHAAVDSVEAALKATFAELSSRIIKSKTESGTTALVTAFFGNELYIANCGDARAVLCRAGNAVRLSVDHKPDDPLERKRIRELGGFVSYTGRILDDIMVARSLGDAQNQPYVTSDPYVARFDMSDDDEFLILGCDGIWDVISDEQAVELVREFAEKESLQAPAVALRDYAYSGGSTDNLSCIIVYFKRALAQSKSGKASGKGAGDKSAKKGKKSK